MADLPNDPINDPFGLFNDWLLSRFSGCSKLHLLYNNNDEIK
ncbi:hypothetical protein SAMN05660816_04878 [Niastella yeongjuensis]|nr:hypothetical protein SAMN05660816_04878 [Niastella yeongjuensis]